MITWTKPEKSLEAKYYKVIRVSLIGALLLTIGLFAAVPRASLQKPTSLEPEPVQIQQLDIPETEQYTRPPAPARPSVPVASESEDIASDVTIEEVMFEEYVAIDAPPPPPEEYSTIRFIPYDEPPILIGGLQSIRDKLVYPEIAQEAGIEGTVIVQLFIDKNGNVKEVIVIKGIPRTGLDEAAINAVKQTKWKPAKQRDLSVGVWYSIPIVFKIKERS